MKVRAVSLDAAGTLITVAAPVGETYARLAARHGIDIAPARLDEGFRRLYPGMPPLAFAGLEGAALHAAERRWWHALVAAVFGEAARAPAFDAFFDTLYAHYAEARAWRVYDEVFEVLATLRARGIALVVTSNFDSRLHGILAGLRLRDALDAVVCSSEAGAAKPDARVFAAACAAVASTPADTLHVGDDPRADLQGARDAGLHALLLDRHAGHDAAPAHIATLAQLPAALEGGDAGFRR